MVIRKLVNKIWVYALLLIVMSACGSKTDNSNSYESTTTESGTPTEFKVPNVNCESAVNDPLTEVTDFKDVQARSPFPSMRTYSEHRVLSRLLREWPYEDFDREW